MLEKTIVVVMRPMTIVVTMRSIRNPTSPLFEVKSVLLGYVEIQSATLLYAFTRSIFIRCIFVSISPDPHISLVRRGFSPCSPLRGPSEEDHPEEDHPCAEADAEADFVFEKVFTFGPACSYLLCMDC